MINSLLGCNNLKISFYFYTAGKLISICIENQLIPEYLLKQVTSLESLFCSGIPSLRNKLGGHGQGANIQKVDDEMVRYCLNLTGTTIIFFIEISGIK